jgi:hypothetical protein
MALTSLYGRGGGKIPFGNNRYLHLSASRLARIIAAMPHQECGALHRAAHQGDGATAQRMLREAAVAYLRRHETDLTASERDLLAAVGA